MNGRFIIVRGKVIAGMGDGKKFVSLPWFKRQVAEIFNFEPYPGTLNVMLTEDSSGILSSIINEKGGFKIIPEEGYSSGFLYRALICFRCIRVIGAIVRPSVPGYPENIMEIVAPLHLREFLGLNDGDEIDVAIFFE